LESFPTVVGGRTNFGFISYELELREQSKGLVCYLAFAKVST
jgi:hypothetical protein